MLLAVVLLLEGGLLFVAANTGFLGGPRVLANMAVDSWVPHRFYQLSDRLVTKNGTLLMGGAALAIPLYSEGQVGLLVVLYSLNVFVTFTLSQLGMCIHWWQVRGGEQRWKRRLAMNGLGLTLTSAILLVTLSLKFEEGGWVTVVITSTLIAACMWIRSHYGNNDQYLDRLNAILTAVPVVAEGRPLPACDRNAPTAVLLVTDYNGMEKSNTVFGSFFRRLRTRLDKAQATGATAHMIARVVYRMLKYKVENERIDVEEYEVKYKEQQIKYLKKKAAKLGFQLVPA